MAHHRQWSEATLGGGTPACTGHGCARRELLHEPRVEHYGSDTELPEQRRSPAMRALSAVTSRQDTTLGLGHATHLQEGIKEERT
jgi:uncharacterized membrane-anchored protein